MLTVDYSYLRPKKAASLKQMCSCPYETRQELSVWRGRNATLFPLREVPGDGLLFGRAGVVDENGGFVALSGIEGRIWNSYPCENPEYRDEKIVYCGYLVNHWGHFLVEAVTRLWYFLENDASIDKYVFVLDENEERSISGNYLEFFRLLKIWDKIEIINHPTAYREVIVPEMGTQVRKYCSPKMIRVFDTVADNVEVDPAWTRPEKIFFSRTNFAKGNDYEFGLEALDNFFAKNGFAILAPEKLPLGQMIYSIRNASQIASISGSTPHNMVFAKDGQNLIILERLVMNNDCQINVNLMRQLNVTYIDANFQLYPVDWCGPYIVGCNDILERYIQDNHMSLPDGHYLSEKYRDKCARQYLRSYHNHYRYRWFMEDWYSCICDTLWEAYQDGCRYFRPFLDGEKPFLPEHYFQPHYIKQLIKRFLRKKQEAVSCELIIDTCAPKK